MISVQMGKMAGEETTSTKRVDIPYGDKKILAAITTSTKSRDHCVVFTHGAGGDMDTPQVAQICEGLATRGFTVLRFTCKSLNLKYRAKVYAEMVKYLKNINPGIRKCLVGGRSMGSRAAVEVANQIKGTELESFIEGVICVSYPLYPPDSRDKIRDAPLYSLELPVICLSGDQDEMCDKATFEKVLSKVKHQTVMWLEKADHSLVKSSGLEKTVDFVVDGICAWYARNFEVNQDGSPNNSGSLNGKSENETKVSMKRKSEKSEEKKIKKRRPKAKAK